MPLAEEFYIQTRTLQSVFVSRFSTESEQVLLVRHRQSVVFGYSLPSGYELVEFLGSFHCYNGLNLLAAARLIGETLTQHIERIGVRL